MTKIFAALILSLISYNAFAVYSIKIPLELHNGGTLPTGSIIIGNGSDTGNGGSGSGTGGGGGTDPTSPEASKSKCLAKSNTAKSIVTSSGYVFNNVEWISKDDLGTADDYCIVDFYKNTCSPNTQEIFALTDKLNKSGFQDVKYYTQCI